MPYEDPDVTDPMTRHGVMFETENGEAMREMALCFIEEYRRSGLDRDRLLQLFATKDYAGPHLAYMTLGEQVIREMIDACMLRWGTATGRTVDMNEQGKVKLPVVEP